MLFRPPGRVPTSPRRGGSHPRFRVPSRFAPCSGWVGPVAEAESCCASWPIMDSTPSTRGLVAPFPVHSDPQRLLFVGLLPGPSSDGAGWPKRARLQRSLTAGPPSGGDLPEAACDRAVVLTECFSHCPPRRRDPPSRLSLPAASDVPFSGRHPGIQCLLVNRKVRRLSY